MPSDKDRALKSSKKSAGASHDDAGAHDEERIVRYRRA